MMNEENFAAMASLIGEPARAKMLWNLLDGRAYTANELAMAADISTTSASNHLSKLLAADLLKVEVQGRHRYFSFSKPEVAYAVEAIASIIKPTVTTLKLTAPVTSGIKYCRTCYDHLAGYAGVQFTLAMKQQSFIKEKNSEFEITKAGWIWLAEFDIQKAAITNSKRPVVRQCLDWSERKPHLAGQVGALLLTYFLKNAWMKKINHSRELMITAKGKKEIYDRLRIVL